MHPCKEHAVCSLSHRKRGSVKLSGFYRVFLGRKEQQNIWIVDGAKVALKLFPDFIMGGNDQRYRFEPENDVWIDNRIGIEELNYTIAHELIERRLMREKGWTYDRAHEEGGLAVERTMRTRDARLALRKGTVYRQYFGKRDGVVIWIVDGPLVRHELNPDFCFATHDLRSKFVPSGEIWLDSAMGVEEAFFALRHARIERALMADGVKLGAAYERAQRIVHRERAQHERRAAKHEDKLAPVRYGTRHRGVKPKGESK